MPDNITEAARRIVDVADYLAQSIVADVPNKTASAEDTRRWPDSDDIARAVAVAPRALSQVCLRSTCQRDSEREHKCASVEGQTASSGSRAWPTSWRRRTSRELEDYRACEWFDITAEGGNPDDPLDRGSISAEEIK